MTTFPLVVGCRRSGLGLLRVMCASHPLVTVPPPATFAVRQLPSSATWASVGAFDPARFVDTIYESEELRPWRLPRADVELSFRDDPPASYADAVRRVYRLWVHRQGKTRYVDVSPGNTLHVDALTTLFPEARIVHLVRDGRDVGASLQELGWVDNLDDAALHWRYHVRAVRRSLRRLPPSRYHEIRYDDLVRSPEDTVRQMCEAIDLPFHPAMLDYRDTAAELVRTSPRPHQHRFLAHQLMPALRDWRRDLPDRAVDRFDALAGDVLIELGYELRSHRQPWPLRLRANARRLGPRRRRRLRDLTQDAP